MDTDSIDPTDDAIARALDARREQERISRPDLARRAGIPYQTAIRYLTGKRAIPMSKFIAMASAMGVPVAELIDAGKRILESAEKEQRI
jgi:transcriptional regulator with XRE-family HTH domain